jgi:2-amino-4-hydroxy-6-hydroxymethyldihydropteridine diphosphokinase
MTDIYLALGSNMGDSAALIDQAVKLLREKVSDIKQAPLYHSKAYGYTDQPDFFNTALFGQTELGPEELLEFVKEVEREVGRVKRFRWGPREIDIDIIFYGNETIDHPHLHIPHADFANRDFVLKPLCDLNPDFKDPRSKLSMKDLLNKLPTSVLMIHDGS